MTGFTLSPGCKLLPGRRNAGLLPGLLLCAAVTLGALGLERIEIALFGRAWLESLVLAILVGTALRGLVSLGERWGPGIRFSSKLLLETAVMLLGASISASAILDHGLLLLGGIGLVVVLAISISYALGRLFGLPHKLATLIACGNSICGNSAIAAVAPVISADSQDIASAISFTAVLGVVVVVVLPLLVPLLSLSALQYGVFAGLTVYAVPQVLAATAPVAQTSVQMGMLVKLVRVMTLAPVLVVLALLSGKKTDTGAALWPRVAGSMPWFILGFLLLLTLRSCGLIPVATLEPTRQVSAMLTIMSMAALGLGVDVRSILRASVRTSVVVILSLLVLCLISFALVSMLNLG